MNMQGIVGMVMVLVIGVSAVELEMGMNPKFIKTGRVELVNGLPSVLGSNIITMSRVQNGQHSYEEYVVKFTQKFNSNTPKFALSLKQIYLGLSTFQFNSASISSTNPFYLDLNVFAVSFQTFRIKLIRLLASQILLTKLTVNYLAVDTLVYTEFIVIQKYFQDLTSATTIVSKNFQIPPKNPSKVISIQSIIGFITASKYINIQLLSFSISDIWSFPITKIYQESKCAGYVIIIDLQQAKLNGKIYSLKSESLYFHQNKIIFQQSKYDNSFFGLARAYFVQSGFNGFSIDQNNKITSYPYFNQLQFLGFNVSLPQCNSPDYYYTPFLSDNNNCTNQCEIANIKHNQNKYCLTCIDYCKECLDQNICKECIDPTYLESSSKCVCKNDYYQQLTQKECKKCPVFPVGCMKCDSVTCLRCNTTKNFNNTFMNGKCQCVNNSILNEETQSCQCIEWFFENNNECRACHSSCYRCNDTTQNNCTQCNYVYSHRQQDQTRCPCVQPQYFMQIVSSNTDSRVCYFKPDIIFQLNITSLTKDADSNTLIYNISILPVYNFLNNLNFSKVLDFGIQQSEVTKYQYENGKLLVYLSYNTDAHNQSKQLRLNLSNILEQKYSKSSVSKIEYFVVPENNMFANYFPAWEYQAVKPLKYAIYGLLGLALATLMTGMYSSKLVVSEMIGVLQIGYFGLLIQTNFSPLTLSLSALKYSNGYNDILPSSVTGQLPKSINLLGYSQLLFVNLNTSLVVLIIPFIISIIFYLLFKIQRKQKQRNKKLYMKNLGEIPMVSVLFVLYNLSTSTALFIAHPGYESRFSIGSVVEICISYLIVLFVCLMYGLTDYNYLGQFKYMFLWKTYELNYYFIMIGARIVFGSILGAYQSVISGAIVSTGFLIIGIITIVRPPYSDKLHSVRAVINIAVSLIIMGLYTVLVGVDSVSGNSFTSKIPIIIVILLYLIVITAIIFIIRQFIADIKTNILLDLPQTTLQQDQKQLQQMMKKKIQESMKNGEVNLANKIYLNNKKKLKKRRKAATDIGQDTMNMNISDLAIQRGVGNQEEGLTIQRIFEVDRLLKQGLV